MVGSEILSWGGVDRVSYWSGVVCVDQGSVDSVDNWGSVDDWGSVNYRGSVDYGSSVDDGSGVRGRRGGGVYVRLRVVNDSVEAGKRKIIN